MIKNFKDMNDARVLLHDNDGPEIRFINEREDYVMYKKLTDQELMDMAYYLQKVLKIEL